VARGEGDGATAKRWLLAVAALRVVAGVVALVLAPFLYQHHFLALVLLRPSAGVLLTGSVLARHGDLSLVTMIAAAIPLQLVAVWLYFLLGEAWRKEIEADDELPFVAARLLPPRRIRRLQQALRDRGTRFVVLARFAVFPEGALAAAAGASDMELRPFLVADGGALAAELALVVGAGYGLGVAADRAGPWLAFAGAAALVALAAALTSTLWRGAGAEPRHADAASRR
jgi:membrane protein DedA with SNARE-associated domain